MKLRVDLYLARDPKLVQALNGLKFAPFIGRSNQILARSAVKSGFSDSQAARPYSKNGQLAECTPF